jgi:hypothetical protein
MNDRLLRIYLNDHLAGALAGVNLARSARDHADSPQERAFLDRLVKEIREDERVLTQVVQRVGGRSSGLKRPLAWAAERIMGLRLRRLEWSYARLGGFERLEALLLGVRGKLALWRTLETVGDQRFSDLDFGSLQARAKQQIEGIEKNRVARARDAFC